KEVNSGLYIYHSPEQIDSIYNWAFSMTEKPLSTIDFYKIMLHLADYEGSVHNYTEPDSALMGFIKRQQAYFPYSLLYINGQIIFDGQGSEIPAGSRILSINGIKDSDLMNSFYKYYPTDGFNLTRKMSASVNKSFGINYLLEYGLSDNYRIEYLPPNVLIPKSTILPAVDFEERTKNLENSYSFSVTDLLDFKTQEPYSFKILPKSIGLLNLRWFGMVSGSEDPKFEGYVQFLDSVFTQVSEKKISNLIIDIRNNPGGSDPTFEQPMMFLTDQTFKENVGAHIIFNSDSIPYRDYFFGVSTTKRMDSSALETGKKFLKDRFPKFEEGISLQNQKYNPTYYPKSPIFTGNLYLLINENVASAASHFASLVRAYCPKVVIIGVETVGGYYVHNGHIPFVYELPNSKIKTQFSIVHVIQDAPKKEGQPIGR